MCISLRYFNYWTTRMNVVDNDNSLFDRLFLNIYCLQTMRDVNIQENAKQDFYRRDAFYIWNTKKLKEYYESSPSFRDDIYYGLLTCKQRQQIVDNYNKLNKTHETTSTFFYFPEYDLF